MNADQVEAMALGQRMIVMNAGAPAQTGQKIEPVLTPRCCTGLTAKRRRGFEKLQASVVSASCSMVTPRRSQDSTACRTASIAARRVKLLRQAMTTRRDGPGAENGT